MHTWNIDVRPPTFIFVCLFSREIKFLWLFLGWIFFNLIFLDDKYPVFTRLGKKFLTIFLILGFPYNQVKIKVKGQILTMTSSNNWMIMIQSIRQQHYNYVNPMTNPVCDIEKHQQYTAIGWYHFHSDCTQISLPTVCCHLGAGCRLHTAIDFCRERWWWEGALPGANPSLRNFPAYQSIGQSASISVSLPSGG